MATIPCRYPNVTFYVATTGSDSTGTGTFTNPWATPGKARDVITASGINRALFADITVNVAPGTYPVASTIRFGVNDSGRGQGAYHIKYVSTGGPGAAIFDAGTQVTGWVNYSGSIYRTAISSSLNFWTLYENGTRARMARTPQWALTAGFPSAMAPYYTSLDPGSQPNINTVKYANSDFNPSTWTAADLQTVTWSGGSINWTTDTTPVTSRDTTNKLFGLASTTKFRTFGNPGSGGSRYFVQGDLSMLTGSGQWYYDRTDAHGSPGGGLHYLYYWARDGAIASQDIRLPNVGQVFSFVGNTVSDRVTGILLDGFVVKNTDFTQTYRWGYSYDGIATLTPANPPHVDPGYGYFVTMPYARTGAIYGIHTDNVVIQNCRISATGMHGIYFEGAIFSNTVQDSWVEKTGHSGIVIEGGWPGEGDYTGGNLLSDLRVNNVGELVGMSSNIDIINSGSNTLTHLDLHDGPRKALWLRGEDSVALTQVYTKNNTVSYAKVAKVCQDSGDTGAVGCTGFSSTANAPGPWNTNFFNQITVDSIYAHPSMTDEAPNGVFTDDQTNGQQLSNIQVTNTQGAQFRSNGTNAATHTLTNTSFLDDGTPNGAFNASLMDLANIGTTGAFPY